jgi:hypothetical protein
MFIIYIILSAAIAWFALVTVFSLWFGLFLQAIGYLAVLILILQVRSWISEEFNQLPQKMF